jgi:hypothetical protein
MSRKGIPLEQAVVGVQGPVLRIDKRDLELMCGVVHADTSGCEISIAPGCPKA